MAHGSWLAPPRLVQGDYSYEDRVESHVVEVDRQGEGEWLVVADPVGHMYPTGNLE
jgi:hypothetical protein